MGQNAITQKLSGLPFQTVSHDVLTADYQPSPGGCILVMVRSLSQPPPAASINLYSPALRMGCWLFNRVGRRRA